MIASPADAAKSNAKPIAVNITADALTAAPDSIRTGQVTFQVMNRTAKAQDFQISGPNVYTELADIAAGGSGSVTLSGRARQLQAAAEDQDGNHERVSRLIVMR